MKNLKHWGLSLVALSLTPFALLADPTPEELFAHPPKEARPQVWWHWMNGNVSKEGITDDLEALAAQGIGGATLFNLSCEIPEGPVAFGSDEWFDCVTFALQEAKRTGVDITLHNCPGWTSSGGPWVSADDAMKRQVWSETDVVGGTAYDGTLPQPGPLVDGYYRDASVVAFPVPEAECRPALSAKPFVFRQTETKPNAEIDLTADEPVQVTAVTADIRGGRHWYSTYRLEIFASDDGMTWREIATARSAYRDKGLRGANEKSFPVPATTARRFRVRIVFDVDLSRGSEPSGERDGTYTVDRLVLDGRGVVPKILTKTLTAAGRLGMPSEPAEVAADQAVARKDIVDLTDRMTPEGRLAWTPPDARHWKIVRFGYTLTGAHNHPAPQGGVGYEVDKLSADAMRRHMTNFVGRILREAGDAADAVKAVLIDSYEVGPFNWTAGLEKKYARRWGEEPTALILALTGRVINAPAETEDLLGRFRTLVSELFATEYAGTFTEMCHAYGVESSIEPYVSPTDDREYARHCDIPMGEFWPGGNRWGHPGASRLAPSAAHFFGRRICAAEAFSTHPNTPGGRFGFAALALKGAGDRMFTIGYNRMHINSFVHQPWTVPGPGMTMGLWGLRADRTQPWWPEFKPFMTYLARVQAMLQGGQPVVDVLYYGGDEPLAPLTEPDASGFTWDLCGTSWLHELKVVDGRPVAPSGLAYEALVVRESGCFRESTRRVLGALKAQGVRFSLEGLEADFVEVPKRGQVNRLFVTHRRYSDGSDGYFVSSTNQHDIVCALSFRQTGRRVELWDAETGRIRPAEAVADDGRRTCVDFRLDPAGSVFVMFRPNAASEEQSAVLCAQSKPKGFGSDEVLAAREVLAGPWRLTFPFGKTFERTALFDWSQAADADVRYFSGRAVYETTVASGGLLDLGDVRNFAVVSLDGESVATLWKPPYRCELPRGGRLTVEVVNLWPNRLIGDERLYPADCQREGGRLKAIPGWVQAGKPSPTGRKAFSAWRHYTKDDALLPSGLLGPVTIVRTYPRAFFDEKKVTPLDYVLAHPETDWLERAPGEFEIPFVAAFPKHWWTKGPQYPGNGECAYPGGRLAFKRAEIRANPSKRFDAVFVGDSITHNWETLGSNVLHGVLGKYRILNIGNGNDRTSHALWDVRNGLLDGYETPLVVLHIGTNNANRPGSEPEATACGIAEIVRAIRAKQPQAQILLMPILPRGEPGDLCRAENERVNRLIRPLADGTAVVWFDLRAKFLDADGRIRPGLMLADRLHPGEKGYSLWAEALVPALEKSRTHGL